MNYPECGSGNMEYIGKSVLYLLHNSINANLSTEIPIDVYICSFEDCSHIDMKGRNREKRKVKAIKRREFISKGTSL